MYVCLQHKLIEMVGVVIADVVINKCLSIDNSTYEHYIYTSIRFNNICLNTMYQPARIGYFNM